MIEVCSMWISITLFAFFVNLITAFLLMYCLDEIQPWDRISGDTRLLQPEIGNLKNADEWTTQQYVQKVVCPAYYYFRLRSEVESDNGDATGNLAIAVFLQLGSFLFIPKCLYRIGFTENGVLCVAISIVACCIGCLILHFIYKRHLRLQLFNYTKEQLVRDFQTWPLKFSEGFDLSEQVALNNHMIFVHMEYLMSVRETVAFRRAMKKILAGIAAAIYFLFFFTTGEP